MKKLSILFLIMALGVTGIVFGQFTEQLSDTATLGLSGTVPQYVEITINANGAGTGLDLTQEETTAFEVATVTESGNTPYTVSANSPTGFTLQHETETGYAVTYTLFYGGVNVESNVGAVSTGTFGSATTKSITMTHGAVSTSDPSGTYSDTITFTISAD
ncbi:MAG: hypothetical protein WD492_07990 [Alkalispirochaeta sp.]